MQNLTGEMLLVIDIKTIVKYAERRIMWITPNEAKRLGVTHIQPFGFYDKSNLLALQNTLKGSFLPA